MSVYNLMHPRNIYRNKPNYSELAIQFPEFLEVSSIDINGKMKLDFKNPNAFRVLTKCLLKKDFNLDVELPPHKLIPTLTLRLNYILWLEDIIQTFGLKDVHGIDIGSGASCIYPLLAAKLNSWQMTGLEIDKESIQCATENIKRNGLDNFVKIHNQSDDSVLSNFIDSHKDIQFTFCMCNPPFYDNNDDISSNNSNRTGNRKPPPNASTGCPKELAINGGEVYFITKIIEESMELKNRIQFYTTMIGHKKNADIILKVLKQLKIQNFITTRFCQGNTTRWGVAWSFSSEITLPKVQIFASTAPHIKSKLKPLQTVLFKTEDQKNLEDVKEKILQIYKSLELTVNLMESPKFSFIWEISASTNTWSHRRRKKREEARGILPQVENQRNNEIEAGPSKRIKLDEKFLNAATSLMKLDNGDIMFQITYLGGTAGKDATNQILHFLRDNFKRETQNTKSLTDSQHL